MTRKQEAPQKTLIAWENYTNPSSPTFDNLAQSATLAGYSREYALKGLYRSRHWRALEAERLALQEKYNTMQAEERRKRMLLQAEKNLEATLQSEAESSVEKNIKHDATKFIAERIGKEHYATRNDVVNSGEVPLMSGEGAHAIASAFGKYLAQQATEQLQAPRDAEPVQMQADQVKDTE